MNNDKKTNELRDRVIYALFAPAAQISKTFNMPLSHLKKLIEIAYFHEIKKSGVKMKDAAKVMDVSLSKIALLSRALKKNFGSDDISLDRRIEFMLWSGPLTSAKIKQVITKSSATEINQALKQLVEEKKIIKNRREQSFLYSLNLDVERSEWDEWLTKVDTLFHALRIIGEIVYSRFFEEEDKGVSRVLSFNILPKDLKKLRNFYDELFTLTGELDEDAEGNPDAIPISLSLFWAQFQYFGDEEIL